MSGVRSRTRAAIIASIAARLGDQVPVDRAWPGPRLQADHVYSDRIEGEGSLPLIQAGRHEREDTFRVLLQFQATRPGQDAAAAEDRCEELMTAAFEAVAEAQLPGGLLDQIDELVMVDLGQVNGPDSEPHPNGEGYIAFAEAEIACTARID